MRAPRTPLTSARSAAPAMTTSSMSRPPCGVGSARSAAASRRRLPSSPGPPLRRSRHEESDNRDTSTSDAAVPTSAAPIMADTLTAHTTQIMNSRRFTREPVGGGAVSSGCLRGITAHCHTGSSRGEREATRCRLTASRRRPGPRPRDGCQEWRAFRIWVCLSSRGPSVRGRSAAALPRSLPARRGRYAGAGPLVVGAGWACLHR